jgi:hypothetical protein
LDSSKIDFNANFVYEKQVNQFRICSKCDFEWHESDGDTCPVCEPSDEAVDPPGGVLGTAKNQKRLNLYLKAFGILALVYLFARLLQF